MEEMIDGKIYELVVDNCHNCAFFSGGCDVPRSHMGECLNFEFKVWKLKPETDGKDN
jgi:hypothetical protein